ncbi:hypothetical protein JKP88DRAFT_287737 [Tribonema minus]|uniref:Uncharacterized protein n=1 Tax=Tribonema minus TaxID=303371 RepID=A0A835ZB22_9STRA|nr:hypothetical protein JKP88DRAFT_287737 [Tribonema minus]
MGMLAAGQSDCVPPGQRCDGEGDVCCACADTTVPACIIFNGVGQRDGYSLCACKAMAQRDDYSLCECKADTCEASGGSCVKNCGSGDAILNPRAPGGSFVKNCGSGNNSNCSDACGALGIPFVDVSQCNAAQGGGWKCPGTNVCCHCNAPSSVLPIKVSVKKSSASATA